MFLSLLHTQHIRTQIPHPTNNIGESQLHLTEALGTSV